jgi:hypothetical protein
VLEVIHEKGIVRSLEHRWDGRLRAELGISAGHHPDVTDLRMTMKEVAMMTLTEKLKDQWKDAACGRSIVAIELGKVLPQQVWSFGVVIRKGVCKGRSKNPSVKRPICSVAPE